MSCLSSVKKTHKNTFERCLFTFILESLDLQVECLWSWNGLHWIQKYLLHLAWTERVAVLWSRRGRLLALQSGSSCLGHMRSTRDLSPADY